MARARDSQRSKVYEAERAIEQWDSPTMSIAECRKWVEKITGSATWGKLYTGYANEIEVKDGRGTINAMGWEDGINLPRWARTEIVILHELAHTVTGAYVNKRKTAWRFEASHGRLYCRNYLKLVRRFMGKDVHDELKASFKKHKVKYNRMRDKSKMLNSVSMNGKPNVPPAHIELWHNFYAEDYREEWIITMTTGEGESKSTITTTTPRFRLAGERFKSAIGELYLEGFR